MTAITRPPSPRPEPQRGALSRRRFLQRSAELGAGAALLAAGCGGPVSERRNEALLALPPAAAPGQVVFGRFAADAAPVESCRALVEAAGGLPWLRSGDPVFLKLASNSPYPHPAVTWPGAVTGMVALLREAGAKTIYVGDQAGVEHVRLEPERRVSATRAATERSGLLAAIEASGAQAHFFDDGGFSMGYRQVEFAPTVADHWDGALWLPRIVDEVDHVVNLPRLAHHALAGYTCGAKIAVGWLRDDSRLHLHQRGDTFFEQIAEISEAPPLRERLRLTLTLGTGALLNIGPDFGSKHDLGAQWGLAATKVVDHDLLASALLEWLDGEDLAFYDLYSPYPAGSEHFNRGLVEDTWGEGALADYRPLETFPRGRGLAQDRCLARLAQLQGYRPTEVRIRALGQGLPTELAAWLPGHGDGMLRV